MRPCVRLRITVNYGWGVSGNAALNTVVMCPDLRKRVRRSERRMIGERARAGGSPAAGRRSQVTDLEFDAARGEAVLPLVARLLGLNPEAIVS